MKVKEALSTFKNTFNAAVSNVSFKIEQKAPEICLVVGIVGVVGACVVACKATLSLPEIVEETKEKEEELKEQYDKTVTIEEGGDIQSSEKSEAELKNDIRKLYLGAGFNIAKLYIPAVLIGSIAIGLILKSHFAMVSRNIAICGAYAALQKEFDEYRKNVINKYGEDADKEMRFGINPDADESEESKTETTALIPARTRFIFDETTSDLWQKSLVYNIDFLSLTEHNANELLRAKRHLFVNDILEMMHMDPIQSGQDNGWVYDPMIEHKIVFTTYTTGDNSGIWFELNIDGDIRHSLIAA